MTSLSPTADIVALVQASTVLPYMLFCLAAGAAADVFDRRILMLAAQLLALVVSVLLTIFTYTGVMTPWLLLTFTFLVGCGNAIYGPAWQASVGELVPRAELPAAVSLNSLGFNIARTVGPAIGGVIVAVFGSPAAFLVNSISYLGLIGVLFCWRRPVEARPLPPEIDPRRHDGRAALRLAVADHPQCPGPRRGVRHGRQQRVGADAAGRARPDPGRPDSSMACCWARSASARCSSALLEHAPARRFSTERIVIIATFAFAANCLIASVSRTLPLTMFGMVLGGGGWVLALSTFNISIQLSVPRWVVGRTRRDASDRDLRRHGAGFLVVGLGGASHRSAGWLGPGRHHPGALSPLLARFWPMPAIGGEDLDPRLPDSALPTVDEGDSAIATARSSSPPSIASPGRTHRSLPAPCASWPKCASATARAAGR